MKKSVQKKLYLAYGSNMSLEQMYHRCPTAEPVGKGWLPGWVLSFAGSKSGNYATIDKGDGRVPVVVWAVAPEDEKRLDWYEGYPSFYNKSMVPFVFDNGQKATGLVYFLPETSPRGVPNRYYWGVLVEGYDRFGFDQKILAEALDRAWDASDPAEPLKSQKKR